MTRMEKYRDLREQLNRESAEISMMLEGTDDEDYNIFNYESAPSESDLRSAFRELIESYFE